MPYARAYRNASPQGASTTEDVVECSEWAACRAKQAGQLSRAKETRHVPSTSQFFHITSSTEARYTTLRSIGHHMSTRVPPQFHSMIAGAGAGLVASVVTCPLDVVKTRLQAQASARSAEDYEGVKATVARIVRQSGVRGLYRGLGPTILGYLPTWGIYFTVYDEVKQRLGQRNADGQSSILGRDSWAMHIVAAMTAGASGTLVTNPLWVIKTRFMAQAVLPAGSKRYRNTADAVVKIYKSEGIGAFYKGILPSLMGVSHVAVQFPLYEQLKMMANPSAGDEPLPPSAILLCSATSKMVATLATYPHEVLRTRLQIEKHDSVNKGISVNKGRQSTWGRPHGVIDTFLLIKRQDGWKGFYRGLSINLVRTVPNSAVTMLTYELIMRELSS